MRGTLTSLSSCYPISAMMLSIWESTPVSQFGLLSLTIRHCLGPIGSKAASCLVGEDNFARAVGKVSLHLVVGEVNELGTVLVRDVSCVGVPAVRGGRGQREENLIGQRRTGNCKEVGR